MAMMGAGSVSYHLEAVLERADDHPGAALAYYGSRGETPLRWGGSGAAALGLSGVVRRREFEALFGEGGARDAWSGERFARTTRPGVELVVGAHKSLAVLGLFAPDDLRAILDAERDATLAYLDAHVRQAGGRRGKVARFTPTSGLTWAHTRHATSRAGDPAPHDHILIANLVEMLDERGGWKGLDTAGLRDALHAATAVGRQAGAWRAIELGYAIVADDGPSGRLGQWAIAGVPDLAMDVFSKRAAEIDDAVRDAGYDSPRARAVAARATRQVKRHTPVGELMPGWLAELDINGVPLPGIARSVAAESRARSVVEPVVAADVVVALADELLAGSRLAERKVFTRHDVHVAAGPALLGRHPDELRRVVNLVVGNAETVPLVGVAGARLQPYTTASVLAVEQAIADFAAHGTSTPVHVEVPVEVVTAAIAARQRHSGGR
jgi:conjugative relaxase-like TrwC/TraI family protein